MSVYRDDVAYERMHQKIIEAILDFERAREKKKHRLLAVKVTYDSKNPPYFDVDVQEEPKGGKKL